MSGLHFSGRADAYLEWAVASGFEWVADTRADDAPVDLLMQDGAAGPVTLRSVTQGSLLHEALPAICWAELAQAIRISQPRVLMPSQEEGLFKPSALLGLIDSGLSAQWLRANPALKARTQVQTPTGPALLHWDMTPEMSRPLPRVSHGAHVLSWLAGQPPYGGHAFESDAASQCPLMLVNLPTDAVNDPTGRWLGRYVLDGLDHMIRQAQALGVSRLVVNISWGPQTGPHDGRSLLEQALAQRLDQAKAKGLDVNLVLAAGNSRESRAHAQFDAAAGCDRLTWVVPPAGRAPCFLELWWPAGAPASSVAVEVTAPNGQRLHLHGEGVSRNAHACGVLVSHPGKTTEQQRPMALLALNPTGDSGQPAPHGRWRVAVAPLQGAAGRVHAYVARQMANLGGRHQGGDGHLDDPTYGQQRFPRRHGPSVDGQWVTRAGTLSGLATAGHAQVHVAAGAVLDALVAAPYSSEGPSGDDRWPRPDWALPTDESSVLQGLLGAGSRPGSVVRLVGTSMAAPQLARLLFNASAAPSHPSTWDARVGHGVLSLGWTSRHRS